MIQVPVLINCLSQSLTDTLVLVHLEHPEWLCAKFKNYPWSNNAFQTKFITKLNSQLNYLSTHTPGGLLLDRDQLLSQILNLLRQFFLPSFFLSYHFSDLLSALRQYTYPELELEVKKREKLFISYKNLEHPFAILLIDAENISLNLNLETIINQICLYPIKIKLAFANWRSLGKKDLDFYQKGYEMIHVPQGKNSADIKMITVGASIWGHYPMAKEFIICSSDGDLNHLCLALQNNGLNVYRVFRKGENIMVFNSQTGKTQAYPLTQEPEYFTIEDLLEKTKQLITSQQKTSQNIWLKLVQVDEAFKAQYKLSIKAILAHHFPQKTFSEALLDFKEHFVLHQTSPESEQYITIFDITSSPPTAELDLESFSCKSVKDLENSILEIVKTSIAQVNQEYIPINHLASEFQKQQGIPLTQALKHFKLGSKLVKFLQKCDYFQVKMENNIYYVALSKPS